MNIPAYNIDQDNEYYADELSQALVNGLGENGFTITQQTTDNITTIAATAPSGTMLMDTDTDELKVIINGVVKTVTLT